MPPSNAAKAKQTKSVPVPAQGQSRQRRAAAPKKFSRDESGSDENSNDDNDAEDSDEEGDEDDDEEEDEEADDEEDSSAMFLKMFDAIRKNAAKSKTNPRAARQKDLNAKSEKYRREAESYVEEGNAYIDDLILSASLLRSENKNKNAMRTREMQMQSAGEGLWIDASVSMKTALELSAVGDIAGRRVDEINDACRRIALQPERRAKSLRGLKRTVREDVAGVVEHEQVASDAEVLIRNYKAMLRSR